MRRFLIVICLTLFCFGSQPLLAAVLSSELLQQLEEVETGGTVPVILRFSEKTDLSRFTGGRATAGDLILDLKETSRRTQAPVLSFLRVRGLADGARSLWIDNSLALRADRTLLEELALFPEIETVDYDVPVRFPVVAVDPLVSRDPNWSLSLVGVPEVWGAFGLDGSGLVVGSMDTGADLDHPALAGKWRGGGNSWIDIVNGLPDPYDDHGHGTHTIGTMVGGDGPGPFDPDIGVAYNAEFISAKVLDHNNSFSTASIVISGAQWMLDPDGNPLTDDFPHVINNSWYFYSETYTGFHATAAAWVAAGIIPVFCLGNEGPGGGTTRPPGNYDNVLGIGATTSTDIVWRWSSRGPSPAGTVFPDDLNKPDLSAPGDLVLSSVPGGGYQSWSGTSMATPHVAGAVALMLQAVPALTYGEVRQALTTTAIDLGPVGYDYNFGHGRLDVLSAVVEAMGLTGAEDPAPELAWLRLGQNVPNPFNPQTRIGFILALDQHVKLEVFAIDGRAVATLLDREMAPGTHEVSWRGRDRRGQPVPSGLYFYRLSTGSFSETKRMVLMK